MKVTQSLLLGNYILPSSCTLGSVVSNKNWLRFMGGYPYNYIIICLYSYAGIMTKLKDTISLSIKVPYTLLTWSFPVVEVSNCALELF